MTEMELKDRTKPFALRVLKLIDTLPETRSGRVLAINSDALAPPSARIIGRLVVLARLPK